MTEQIDWEKLREWNKLREKVAVEIQYFFQGERPPSWSQGMKDLRLEQADQIIKLIKEQMK